MKYTDTCLVRTPKNPEGVIKRFTHEMDHVITVEEALIRDKQEEEAYAEDLQRTQVIKDKVATLKDHSDSAISFLATQLHRLMKGT